MGGYGSGRQGGQGKQTVDRAGSVVDIGNLKIPPDAIEVRIFGRFTWNPQAAVQTITIDWTPCNFGGKRAWFLCPECDGRVRKLYQPEKNLQYRCRDCHSLTYESCQWSGDALGQAKLKVDRLRKKLRAGPLLGYKYAPLKPPGMHQKTYLSLLGKLEQETYAYFQCLKVYNNEVNAARIKLKEFMELHLKPHPEDELFNSEEGYIPLLDLSVLADFEIDDNFAPTLDLTLLMNNEDDKDFRDV